MMHWCISSSLLISAVILLRKLNGTWVSARMRYATWGVVLVRLLIPFWTQFYYNSILGSKTMSVWLVQWDRKLTENQEFYQLLMAIYLFGVLITGTVLLISNLRFSYGLRRQREEVSVKDIDLPTYVTAKIDSPCLVGVIRPCIYVNPLVYGDEELLNYTLLHEVCHFRRKDYVWSFLRCLCLCLHWYNPLVWVAAYLSKIDSELACDEAVVHKIGYENRFDYGRALIAVTCGAAQSLPIAATAMIGNECIVKRRVLRIAAEPYTPVSEIIWTVWMLFLIVMYTCL